MIHGTEIFCYSRFIAWLPIIVSWPKCLAICNGQVYDSRTSGLPEMQKEVQAAVSHDSGLLYRVWSLGVHAPVYELDKWFNYLAHRLCSAAICASYLQWIFRNDLQTMGEGLIRILSYAIEEWASCNVYQFWAKFNLSLLSYTIISDDCYRRWGGY